MKKWIAVFGFLLVLTSAISTTIIAANEYTEKTFYQLTIEGNGIQKDVDYSFEDNALIICSEKEMTISGTSTINENTRIKVTSEHGANLIFSDLTVEIFLGELNDPFKKPNRSAAFGVDDNVEYVNITLKGTNKLQSGPDHAGLENNSVPLVIKGDGELTALGYDGGAGIGGGKGKDGENITIEGGTIIATGIAGAGIGGGENKSGRHIKISGGTVTATGTYKEAESSYDRYPAGGAGIGGGLYGDGTDIEISGGTVTATVENSGRGFHFGGAGIGGGCGGIAENITISGGKVIVETCGTGTSGTGAGIGGGCRSDFCTAAHPSTTSGGTCTNITIAGSADVEARAHYNGAGIGGGCGGSCDTITIKLDDNGKIYAKGSGGAGIGGGDGGNGENINISGKGEITAENLSSIGGAGIGGGNGGEGKNINISGTVKVTTYASDGAGIGGGRGGDGSEITIKLDDNESGFVNATCGSSGAGIGGGSGANGYNITIDKGKVTATSSSGAGIGGGAAKYTPPVTYDDGTGIGSNITIKGGLITATSGSGAGIGGGSHSAGSNIKIYDCTSIKATSNGGAGIGGGSCGNGTDITISGGKYIEANGGQGSAGIGGGMNQRDTGGNGTNIIISGGEIHAKGGSGPGGAGIGSGYNGNAEGIKISDNAKVEAHGVAGAAGIGGGMNGNVKDIEISGKAEVEATGQGGAGIGSGSSGNAERIEISGNAKVETTGIGGAGIGSGPSGNVKDIEISGNAKVEATGQGGAGIGSGQGGNAECIEISSGENITATGYGGAGIGSGSSGSCTDIAISSGNVTATGIGSDTINSSGISATDVTIDGKDTVVNANGGGSGAGITGNNIIINSGDITAKGGDNGGTGIDGSTTVRMGESETSYPWIKTNGINGLTTGESRTNLAIVFNIDKTEGTIYGGKVKLTEPYELKAPCTKLTVKTGAEFITDNKLILNDGVILYLEAGAKLDKYSKMTIIKGEIQHEDASVYVEDSSGKMVCDICGKEELHNWGEAWSKSPSHHWHECTPGEDCAVVPNNIEVCRITDNSKKEGYGEHSFVKTRSNNTVTFECSVCGYSYEVTIPEISIYKVGRDGEDEDEYSLSGAKFGLYSNAACTELVGEEVTADDEVTVDDKTKAKAVFTTDIELDTLYYIKETEAPEGYKKSDKVYTVKVTAETDESDESDEPIEPPVEPPTIDGKVTYGVVDSEGNVTPLNGIPTCVNTKITPEPVKIIKEDNGGNPLAGAQFSVFSDEECKNLITGTNPTATTAIDTDNASDTYNKAAVSFSTELNKTYYIRETKAPEGYTASNEVYRAVVGADGKVAYSVAAAPGGNFTERKGIPKCVNTRKITPDPIKIIKEDGETGAPLAGAQFSVYSDAACQNPIKGMTGITKTDTDNASNTHNKAVLTFDTELNQTYYIREAAAPEGYEVSGEVYEAAVGADGKVTYVTYGAAGSETTMETVLVCKNYAVEVIESAPARIIKEDGEENPLAGARFGLYSDENFTVQITTGTTEIGADNQAAVSFATEPGRTYYIREIAAPEGYEVSDEVYKAVVDADGKVTYVTYGAAGSEKTSETAPVCKNYAVEVISDPIKIIKEDGETEAPLAGAWFGLYSDAECTKLIKRGTTVLGGADNQAAVSFTTEPDTTYYIREIAAPDGYTASDEIFKAVVDADGKVTYGAADSETTTETVLIYKNYAVEVIESAPARIIKEDGKGKPLAGAQFGLYSNENCTTLITTGTTVIGADDKAAVSFATEPGKTYYIKEITPPDGYTASDEIFKAVVDADGKVTYSIVGSETTLAGIPVCKNYAVKVIVSDPIKIIKVDGGETGAPLAGARFGLYSDAECTNLLTTGITKMDTDNASNTYNQVVVSFTTEPDTTYYIKEIAAPEGYEVSDEVYKAVVDADGKVTYGAAGSETTAETVPVCKNYAVKVIVSAPAKIIKVDGETGDPLTGAQFSIYSDAECKNQITAGTTKIDTDNASATYNKAVVSFSTEPNRTYFIKEISAPDGYRVSHEVFKAVVDADGKVTYGAAGSAATTETVPVCKNEKTDEDDDISDLEPDPEDTPPDKPLSPKTGDTAGSGIAGIAILSGIICAVSLVGLVQKRKKKIVV